MNFDERVWRLLGRIPRGRVTTYGEIAAALGRPNAARAVGNACGHNPNAPGVPCHRVVMSSGKLGGYSGGQEKKAGLLRSEGLAIKNSRIVGFEGKLFRF